MFCGITIMDKYKGSNGEKLFEDDLVNTLIEAGWSADVLDYISVEQSGDYDEDNITSLEENFRKILNQRNRKELNNVPLSDYEFTQVMNIINQANTPVKANILINGKTIAIQRDADSDDIQHRALPVYLRIFEHADIAAGDTVYQIARQVVFNNGKRERRGDVTLLINGLPVIHLEIKASNVPIKEAIEQVYKYKYENIFTGLLGLIQVYFAITPEDVQYFANYGDYENKNDAFVFHWADENNNPIKDWRTICDKHGSKHSLLSIPEAHQLVGYYTVADRLKDTLKVMRSYQCYAVRAILARTKKQKWGEIDPLGGIAWCTTGGGKTLSSFKAGQMIRDLNLADKVVFVVDRTELNSQSLEDYNSFSRQIDDSDITKGEVQNTKSSHQLFAKLKSDDTKNALIITSIQKMNNIRVDALKEKQADLERIRKKRIVFIVDEAQRSQFGSMHMRVKETFPTALYFGFTGTPIMGSPENDIYDTRNIFGDYISVYTIASGIRDKNVLGFAPKMHATYSDRDLKDIIAKQECNAGPDEDVHLDKEKWAIYRQILDTVEMPSEYVDKETGNVVRGIEGRLPAKQYDNDTHRSGVVDNILKNWRMIALGGNGTRFHALLSTSSIKEIIEYYHLFKKKAPTLNVTALFDPNLAWNTSFTIEKEKAIDEIVDDYNKKYGVNTTMASTNNTNLIPFKKDVMLRLAHKKPYNNIQNDHNKQIDILIIDDQLLTGYDSQYINCLYLDRVLEEHKLIQAMSRTNRIYNESEKPFGIVVFYRKIHTMRKNLENALKLYCEGDPVGVIVANPDESIASANELFTRIKKLFSDDGINGFIRLPKEQADRQMFKRLFKELQDKINSARLQGYLTENNDNSGKTLWKYNNDEKDFDKYNETLEFDHETFELLEMRYMDASGGKRSSSTSIHKLGLNIPTSVNEIEMEKIDADYLEKHFSLTVPIIKSPDETEERKNEAISKMEDQFGLLTEKQQKYGHLVLEDVKSGRLEIKEGKGFVDYIHEYIESDKKNKIQEISDRYGIDFDGLKEIIESKPDKNTVNENMRLHSLLDHFDVSKTKKIYGETSAFKAKRKMFFDVLDFIIKMVEPA